MLVTEYDPTGASYSPQTGFPGDPGFVLDPPTPMQPQPQPQQGSSNYSGGPLYIQPGAPLSGGVSASNNLNMQYAIRAALAGGTDYTSVPGWQFSKLSGNEAPPGAIPVTGGYPNLYGVVYATPFNGQPQPPRNVGGGYSFGDPTLQPQSPSPYYQGNPGLAPPAPPPGQQFGIIGGGENGSGGGIPSVALSGIVPNIDSSVHVTNQAPDYGPLGAAQALGNLAAPRQFIPPNYPINPVGQIPGTQQLPGFSSPGMVNGAPPGVGSPMPSQGGPMVSPSSTGGTGGGGVGPAPWNVSGGAGGSSGIIQQILAAAQQAGAPRQSGLSGSVSAMAPGGAVAQISPDAYRPGGGMSPGAVASDTTQFQPFRRGSLLNAPSPAAPAAPPGQAAPAQGGGGSPAPPPQRGTGAPGVGGGHGGMVPPPPPENVPDQVQQMFPTLQNQAPVYNESPEDIAKRYAGEVQSQKDAIDEKYAPQLGESKMRMIHAQQGLDHWNAKLESLYAVNIDHMASEAADQLVAAQNRGNHPIMDAIATGRPPAHLAPAYARKMAAQSMYKQSLVAERQFRANEYQKNVDNFQAQVNQADKDNSYYRTERDREKAQVDTTTRTLFANQIQYSRGMSTDQRGQAMNNIRAADAVMKHNDRSADANMRHQDRVADTAERGQYHQQKIELDQQKVAQMDKRLDIMLKNAQTGEQRKDAYVQFINESIQNMPQRTSSDKVRAMAQVYTATSLMTDKAKKQEIVDTALAMLAPEEEEPIRDRTQRSTIVPQKAAQTLETRNPQLPATLKMKSGEPASPEIQKRFQDNLNRSRSKDLPATLKRGK